MTTAHPKGVDRKDIVMIGTDFHTRGGISSVVNVYRESGLFERFPIVYLASHTDGSPGRKLRYFLEAWLRYLLMLLRRRVGAVHIHVSTGISFWRKMFFMVPTYLARVPAILHLHGGDFDTWHADGSAWRKRTVRYAFDRARSIIVLSRSWEAWARSVTRNSSVVAIYNPVRMPTATDFAHRDPDNILFLGRLGEGKGTYDLLHAVTRLADRHPTVTLVMAGDGELERAQMEVERLGLQGHVRVMNWVTGASKDALLKRAAIYALPSYCEGLPMSVLEAMASGLPIVCTPVGGIPEAVTHGTEGLLVVPGDIDELSQALDALLSQPDLRRQIGAAARQKVESTFSAECVLPQVEAIYQELGIRPVQRLMEPASCAAAAAR